MGRGLKMNQSTQDCRQLSQKTKTETRSDLLSQGSEINQGSRQENHHSSPTFVHRDVIISYLKRAGYKSPSATLNKIKKSKDGVRTEWRFPDNKEHFCLNDVMRYCEKHCHIKKGKDRKTFRRKKNLLTIPKINPPKQQDLDFDKESIPALTLKILKEFAEQYEMTLEKFINRVLADYCSANIQRVLRNGEA